MLAQQLGDIHIKNLYRYETGQRTRMDYYTLLYLMPALVFAHSPLNCPGIGKSLSHRAPLQKHAIETNDKTHYSSDAPLVVATLCMTRRTRCDSRAEASVYASLFQA
jgi:hypothetical protein